jgi:hypothetical protein
MDIAKKIEENIGLIYQITESFSPKDDEERDRFVQAGRIGIWKASKKYDPTKNVKFVTFIYRSIVWEILREIKLFSNKYSTGTDGSTCYENNDELWEYFPDKFTDEHRDIFSLKRAGFTIKDIREKLKTKNIYKVYQKLIGQMKEINCE